MGNKSHLLILLREKTPVPDEDPKDVVVICVNSELVVFENGCCLGRNLASFADFFVRSV